MCRVIYICADIMMNCYLCGEWVSKTVYIYLKSISYNMKTLFVLLGMFVIYPCLYAQDAELQACREELVRGMSQKNRDSIAAAYCHLGRILRLSPGGQYPVLLRTGIEICRNG